MEAFSSPSPFTFEVHEKASEEESEVIAFCSVAVSAEAFDLNPIRATLAPTPIQLIVSP
jgi:hypothetical protein